MGFIVSVFSVNTAFFATCVDRGALNIGHLANSALTAACATSAYVVVLASSVVLYRLSPWHPLAHYPGPPLAKVTKWWMAYWIAKGKRHLVLQRYISHHLVSSEHNTHRCVLSTVCTNSMAPGFALVRVLVDISKHLTTTHIDGFSAGPNELSVSLSTAVRPIYTNMFRAPSYQGPI